MGDLLLEIHTRVQIPKFKALVCRVWRMVLDRAHSKYKQKKIWQLRKKIVISFFADLQRFIFVSRLLFPNLLFQSFINILKKIEEGNYSGKKNSKFSRPVDFLH